MNRILFTAEEIGTALPVADARARHLLRILKVEAGSCVAVGVIDGPVGNATVRAVTENAIELDFVLGDDSGPPLLPITCLLGHPRPIVLRRVLRDFSAVGVGRIVVCGTELGERSYLKSRLWSADGWRRCLIEGAEQAGATSLPRLHTARSVEHGLHLLDQMHAGDTATCLFFDEAAEPQAGTDHGFPARAEPPLLYAIGSERGWTDGERALFHDRGWRTVGLGPRVLRVETAAVAAAVMCAAMCRRPGATANSGSSA
ncbi:MAG: RsmE family RNA methyltransferase [Spirochaetaceae bacterium]|nr:MAG: RsmE family RNA methyltransferase [Spirochaetaceae bacterium]